jgi:hypothetical protein
VDHALRHGIGRTPQEPVEACLDLGKGASSAVPACRKSAFGWLSRRGLGESAATQSRESLISAM